MKPRVIVSALAFVALSGVAVPIAGADNSTGGAAPEDHAAPNFEVYNKPTSGYKRATCAIDLSSIPNGTAVNSVSGCGVTVNFSVPLEKRSVPDGGWFTWSSPPQSETATPHVLFNSTAQAVTLTLSSPTKAFGVEVESNTFTLRNFTGTWIAPDGSQLGSLTRPVHGHAGARLLGAKVSGGEFRRLRIATDDNFAIAQIRVK